MLLRPDTPTHLRECMGTVDLCRSLPLKCWANRSATAGTTRGDQTRVQAGTRKPCRGDRCATLPQGAANSLGRPTSSDGTRNPSDCIEGVYTAGEGNGLACCK